MQNKARITTPDLANERLEKLKELMPDLFNSEGKINIQSLYDLANKHSEIKKEAYEFNWAGKYQCKKLALEPTKSCLLPNFEKSINFDKTENIIIEGDNLEVIKTLYQPYFEKIKCIYIDPPYNTGKDFIYDDKREEGKKAYWQRNGVVHEGVKLTTNPEATGRKHSLWCSFIYPRLMLSRNLLSKDGVIFVSIDDNEVHNLRKMMDEIFGEENFVCQFTREAIKGGSQSEFIRETHDYILVYAKQIDELEFIGFEKKDMILNLQDEKGAYAKGRELNKWGAGSRREDSPGMWFPIKGPHNEEVYPIRNDGSEGRWRLGKEKLKKLVEDSGVIFEKRNDGTYIVYEKLRGNKSKYTQFISILKDKYINAKATEDLKDIFEKERSIFDFSKPSILVKDLLMLSNSTRQDVILDFFAGSGTTAHATIKLNAEEKIRYAKENYSKLQNKEISTDEYLQGLSEVGSRRFILTQLPEYTDEKSEAFKAGYKTISSICIERVKRVGQKIIEEIKLEKDLNDEAKNQIINSLDFGFKTFELKDTNIAKAYYEEENFEDFENYLEESKQLELLSENKTNLAYEIAIKNGFDLSVSFKRIDSIKENEVYQIKAENRESALICVDKEIYLDSVMQIEKETKKENQDWQFFCFDNALNITVKTNLKSKVKTIAI